MLFAAGGVNAAAFQLSEVSTSGLGRAYAGEAAIADNASVVATNPALMSLFKTNQFLCGGRLCWILNSHEWSSYSEFSAESEPKKIQQVL